jgi:hypothetical protein
MAGKNCPRGRGETSNLSNLKIQEHHLDSDYEIVNENLARGETGLLKMSSLVPRQGTGKPRFEARIDDGTPAKRKEPELDIDIKGVPSGVESAFKGNRNGYIGHHTKRSPTPDSRIFTVDISIPAGKVFEGEVSFNVTYSVGAHFSVETNVLADATLVPANLLTKIRNRLKALFGNIAELFR